VVLAYFMGVKSEKDAELAQKLGQLQHFLAVSSQEFVGQLASFGQPNTSDLSLQASVR
jgi:hypothetical protein